MYNYHRSDAINCAVNTVHTLISGTLIEGKGDVNLSLTVLNIAKKLIQ